MGKRHFNVYRVFEFDDGIGNISRRRELVGDTWAVSPAKARANVEYRLRGKSVYGGSTVYDMGADSALEIYYEAEEAV